MNDVEIDPAALAAEADATLSSIEIVEPVAAGGEPGIPIAESWLPTIAGCMPLIRLGLVPQWGISDEESDAWAQALSKCLDQVFPGGMQGKYACWIQLAAVSVGIVGGRIIIHGKLPPLGPKRVEQKPVSESASAAH